MQNGKYHPVKDYNYRAYGLQFHHLSQLIFLNVCEVMLVAFFARKGMLITMRKIQICFAYFLGRMVFMPAESEIPE